MDLDDDWGLEDAIEADTEWAGHNAAQCISEPFALSPPESLGVSLSPSRVLRGTLEPSSLSAADGTRDVWVRCCFCVERAVPSFVQPTRRVKSGRRRLCVEAAVPGFVQPTRRVKSGRRCLCVENAVPGFV